MVPSVLYELRIKSSPLASSEAREMSVKSSTLSYIIYKTVKHWRIIHTCGEKELPIDESVASNHRDGVGQRRLTLLLLYTLPKNVSITSKSFSRFCSSSSITGSSVLANLLLFFPFFLSHLDFFFPPPDPFLFLLRLLKMKALPNGKIIMVPCRQKIKLTNEWTCCRRDMLHTKEELLTWLLID
jgi:hypothetical protein